MENKIIKILDIVLIILCLINGILGFATNKELSPIWAFMVAFWVFDCMNKKEKINKLLDNK